jgi:hypothetical protein
MRHEHCASFLCQHSGDGFGRYIELITDISQHRCRAKRQNRRHHCAATKSWNYDLIAVMHAAGAERELQGKAAGTAKKYGPNPERLSDLGVKGLDCVALNDAAGADGTSNFAVSLLIPG